MELIGYGIQPPDSLNATFAAMADPARRAILARPAASNTWLQGYREGSFQRLDALLDDVKTQKKE
jgi:hypothetical protein